MINLKDILSEGFKKGDRVKYIGKRSIFAKLDPKKVYIVQDVVRDGKGGWTIVVNPETDKYSNYKGGDTVKAKDLKKEGKLTEAEYGTPTGTKTLKSINAKFDDAVFKKPPHRIDKAWVLKVAKKYKVDPKKAIEWVNLNPRINIKEGKLNEGRPMPMDTPNEFAYLEFKKFAYKNRSQYKKDMLKHVRKSDGQADSGKMFKTASSWWFKWAYRNNKEFTHIKDDQKFGRALIIMMKDDNLIFDKKAWKKDNRITHVKN